MSSSSYDILAERTTEYVRLELESTNDRYLKYKNDHPGVLTAHGIDDTNYIRKPNGAGEYQGMWVPPYRQLDIWDYHINRDWSKRDTLSFYEIDNPLYIPPPPDDNPTYVNATTGLYPDKLRRLWDFVYNQEYFLNVETTQRKQRSRAFPRTRAQVLPIVPPYLPDATMPSSLALRYPYAAWESPVYTLSDRRKQAQRYNYISAHSGIDPVGINSYALEPRDITLQYSPLNRPIYRQDEIPGAFAEGYSPIDYGPIVLRGVEAHKNNGWLSMFRQRLKNKSSYYKLPKAPRVIEWYNEAMSLLKRQPTLHLVEVVMRVLPEQAAILWPDASIRPTNEFFRPPRYNKTLKQYVALNAKEEEAYNTMAYLLDLITASSAKDSNGLDFELDVDTTTAVPSAVFYEDAYRVVVIQVRPSSAAMFNFNAAFNDLRSWIVSVPPILSSTEVRSLDVAAVSADVSWFANEEAGGSLTITPVANSRHQVRVDIQLLGEFTVYCDSKRWGRFTFDLASLTITIKRVVYELKDGDTLFRLNNDTFDRQRWSGIRFSSRELTNVRDLSSSQLEGYLATHWTRDILKAENILVVKNVNTLPKFDYRRPLFLAHAKNDRSTWQFIVFELAHAQEFIRVFGQKIKLKLNLPESLRSSFTVVWKTDDGKVILGGSEPELTVVVPQQLQWYGAEVHAPDYVFTAYVKLDIEWPFPVTRDRLIRGDMSLHYREDSGWPLITSEPSRLPRHTDSDLKYLITDPHGRAETLAAPFEGDFFKALVYCYARDYEVDLQNYTRLFPYVQEYTQLMQAIVDDSGGRVGIVTTLSDDLLALLPATMGFPLLFLRLTNYDEDDTRISLAFVVYSVEMERWMNIYDTRLHVLPSWNFHVDAARRAKLKDLFYRTSVENAYIASYAVTTKRDALPTSSIVLQRIQRADFISTHSKEARATLDAVSKQIKDLNDQATKMISQYLATPNIVQQRLQYEFLVQVRELFNYVQYITVECRCIILERNNFDADLEENADAPIDEYSYLREYLDYVNDRQISSEDDDKHREIIRLIGIYGVNILDLEDRERRVAQFARQLISLPPRSYVYTQASFLTIITDVVNIKE